MKPAKDMTQTLRYKNLIANLQSRRPYEKEAALLKEIAGGKQWRMEAVLEAIDTRDWGQIRGTVVFEQAAMFGRLETFQKMSKNAYFNFEQKVSPATCPREVMAAFDMAALQGHYKVADYCLGLGANPNYALDNGSAPRAMYRAVEVCDKRKIDYLVKAGVDVGDYLSAAVATNKKTTVAYLIGKGADVNGRLNQYGTSFLRAVQHGYNDMAHYLLAQGFDLKKAKDANEAIHTAAARNDIGMVETMLKFGVKPNQNNVDIARYYKHQQMADLLEKAMAAENSAKPPSPKP